MLTICFATTDHFLITHILYCIWYWTWGLSLYEQWDKFYSRFSGTDYFHIVDDKLFANASLDRDIIGPPGGPGPHVKIQVRCVVWEEKTGIQYVQTNILTIDILDEDDNPPTVQGETSIAITLEDFSKVTLQYQRAKSTQCSKLAFATIVRVPWYQLTS